MRGAINRGLIWNHKDREDRKGMRSRFLIRGAALRAAAFLCAARGKAPVELSAAALISMRFPTRRAQKSRPKAAPEEEARAHAQNSSWPGSLRSSRSLGFQSRAYGVMVHSQIHGL
jgi:hypothetical protein